MIVHLVLPLIDHSLFGESAEARGAKEFASKYREARKTRSKETFYLLCKHCTFKTQCLAIKQFLEGRHRACRFTSESGCVLEQRRS